MSVKNLFGSELKVVNTGLTSFKESLDHVGTAAVQVEWRPPVDVDPVLAQVLREHAEEIDRANQEALAKVLSGTPHLVGLGIALDVIPGMRKNLILHAGPPVKWENMCGPTRGAIMGGLMYEGVANDLADAERLAASGEIAFAPCHEHAAVGPMAGVITWSMPVFIVRNTTHGNTAFCTLNEGLGKVLRYGAYGEDVIRKLKWMEQVLYPTLKRAVEASGPINLKNLIAQALHMGDEVHNRNRAGTSLFYRAIAPHVVRTAPTPDTAADVLEFINGNDHFFLNLSMPASKATLDAARGVPYSSLCVVMARNGTEFGVQLSGTDGEWFTGPAPVPDALYFPGYSKADANPDIGDSAITETAGLGGFAIASSPAIVQFVGGTAKDAVGYTLRMYEISVGENNLYQIPYLNFRGTPTGIDVRKVIEKNVTPFIDTGVAHKNPGVGQVGAGVLSAPVEPFKNAYIGLAKRLQTSTR